MVYLLVSSCFSAWVQPNTLCIKPFLRDAMNIIQKTREGCGCPKFEAKKVFWQISSLLENDSPIFRQREMLSLPGFGHFPARSTAAGKLARPAGTLLESLLRDRHEAHLTTPALKTESLKAPNRSFESIAVVDLLKGSFPCFLRVCCPGKALGRAEGNFRFRAYMSRAGTGRGYTRDRLRRNFLEVLLR